MPNRDVIFVLGAARSGTSALTRTLSLCGCALPESVIGSSHENPTGFWEPIDVVKLNTEFLLQHDSALGDPSMRLQEGEATIDESEKGEYVRKIREFLAKCPGRALVIKDPRVSEVMDFWLEAVLLEGSSVKVVVAVRHPQEVEASLAALELPIQLASAMWLKYNLLSERVSRGLTRVFVEYSNLLKDWRAEIDRVSKALSIELSVHGGAADEFLRRGQRRAGAISETFGYPWISKVYSILSVAAQDGPIDLLGLDEVYRAYCTSERAFRVALDEFRRHFNPQHIREALHAESVWKSGVDF